MCSLISRSAGIAAVAFTAIIPLHANPLTQLVNVTNITHEQTFTPALVVSHEVGVTFFELGQPANAALATIATTGDVSALKSEIESMDGVLDVTVANGLLPAGNTTVIEVEADRLKRKITVLGMLAHTNDGFYAVTVDAVVDYVFKNVSHLIYDNGLVYSDIANNAGTEYNSEICVDVPGPGCGGIGTGTMADKGYLYPHAGIYGVGDLTPPKYDWRNDVVAVSVDAAPSEYETLTLDMPRLTSPPNSVLYTDEDDCTARKLLVNQNRGLALKDRSTHKSGRPTPCPKKDFCKHLLKELK